MKSKSNLKVFNCKHCNKAKSSISLAHFYAQTIRINNIYTLLLTCKTCKGVELFKIVEPKDHILFRRMHTGIVYHCFSQIHKVYTTNDNVILKCLKCGEKQIFKRDKKHLEAKE